MNILKSTLLGLLMLLYLSSQAQDNKYTLSGKVKQISNGEDIIGALVAIKGTNTGVMCNEYGYFSLTLPEGTYTVVISYLGYKTIEKEIVLNKNVKLNFELEEEVYVTEEVVITGERPDENVTDTKVSTIEVDIKQIKKLPALFGEVDVIKNIQMLPGVQVAGEGNTGLFVRGGGADQNLILIDEAPVYNASHLLGIFSVFNSDALKSAELYKGGIPAQYGGRLSSLVDIRTKDGNSKKFSGTGGIGTISSRLTLEGPIVKDKGSFIVSGRRTYGDLFLKLSSNEELRKNKLYFYDLNAKANYTFNENNRVYVAGYFGRDVFKFGDFFTLDWGNATGTLRWNHIYSNKLFSNTTLVYSNFDYDQDLSFGVQSFNFTTGLREKTIKQDYNYYLNPKNEISFGVSGTQRKYSPGTFKPLKDNSIFKEIKLDSYQSLDGALYLSNKQKINAKISMEYGLRYSIFSNVGEGDVYTYNGTIDAANITDTTSYGNFENIKTFHGFEPRFSGRYLLDEKSSVKVSYNRMIQYIHLVANSLSPLPFNIWTPSTPHIKPEYADQVAAGYFRNFKDNKIEASVEAYYKNMENVLDFKDNADLLLNPHIETEIRSGTSWSYGLEFFVRKNKGKTTGWISYTLSKTDRKIPGVNNDLVYAASYDRRHNFNIVASHDFSERFNISGNWIYGTGRPIGLPGSKFDFDYLVGAYYPARNSVRLPDYHRFDFAVTLNGKKKENRKWEGSWNFSIFNLYARKNPFTIFTADKKNSPGQKELRMIYFGGPIPAITYNFKF